MVSSTVSRVEIDRSRRLIQDSRVLLASAREALQQAREALARQHYLQIVCTWCQQTIRWACCEQADWGQVSHSLASTVLPPCFQSSHLGPRCPLCPSKGYICPRRSPRGTNLPRAMLVSSFRFGPSCSQGTWRNALRWEWT